MVDMNTRNIGVQNMIYEYEETTIKAIRKFKSSIIQVGDMTYCTTECYLNTLSCYNHCNLP